MQTACVSSAMPNRWLMPVKPARSKLNGLGQHLDMACLPSSLGNRADAQADFNAL
jgi:hypothetical protein